MRICLIRTPAPFLINDRVFAPLGLLAVGTGLISQGHNVTLFDGDPFSIPLDFAYYGFGPTIPEYIYAVEQMRYLRAKCHFGCTIIIGGPYASLDPKRCLADGFDAVVVGDGEYAAEQAFKHRFNERIIYGDALPLANYHISHRSLIDNKKYGYQLENRIATSMVTSRGCPFSCAFCSKNESKLRMRPAWHVIEEIRYLKDVWKFQAIVFMDDLFTAEKQRAQSIAEELKRQDMTWRCMVRADLVVKHGKDFAKYLYDCGLISVGMGIESGSDKILSIINKAETSSTMKKAIKMLKEVGVKVKGFIILGLPGESMQTIEETDNFLKEVKLDDVDIKIFQPFPGSPIWKNKSKYDINWNEVDLSDMFYKGKQGLDQSNVFTSSLTAAQITEQQGVLERAHKQW